MGHVHHEGFWASSGPMPVLFASVLYILERVDDCSV